MKPCACILVLVRNILPGEQPLIQHEFHATDQQMGALTTAFFFTYMFAAPLSGWLGDRFRRKPLIIIGAILWSLATLASAFVDTYWGLYTRRAMVGVGEATFGIFAPAVLADFYPDRERNRILSVFYLAIPVGAALGYLAGGEMGTLWGWRTPFLICAIPGLAVALLYMPFGREPERGAFDRPDLETSTRKDHHPFGDFFERFLAILKNPAFLTATFGLAQITFALGGISAVTRSPATQAIMAPAQAKARRPRGTILPPTLPPASRRVPQPDRPTEPAPPALMAIRPRPP